MDYGIPFHNFTANEITWKYKYERWFDRNFANNKIVNDEMESIEAKIKEKGDERIFSLVFRTNDPRLGSKFCSVYGGCLGSQFLLVKPFFQTIYAPRNPRILWILSPIPFREPMEIYPSHFYFTKRLDNRPNFPSSPLIISLYIKIRFCEKLSRNCRSLPALCHD